MSVRQDASKPTTWRVGLLLALLGAVACSSSGFTRATVVKLVSIQPPPNLSDDSTCVALWGNIARYGQEMDHARTDWNQVVIESASMLIERGCVVRALKWTNHD